MGQSATGVSTQGSDARRSRVLGHSDIGTALQIHTHAVPETLTDNSPMLATVLAFEGKYQRWGRICEL
jgi:hypothetical protein